MSEAKNRLVIEDYPADKLPADMRGDFASGEAVHITIERKGRRDAWDDFLGKVRRYHDDNPGKSVTSEQAVARVRALRDEWD